MNSLLDIGIFKILDTDPGGTLIKFNDYTEQLELLFKLIFRKADGTSYNPNDEEKKALLLLKGGTDMKTLFTHVGAIAETDDYTTAVAKIKNALNSRTNKVVQRNMLLANHPQGTKSFERWSQEVSNAAKLIDYQDYNWKQATVDAIILQTSHPKLRERALQENITYEKLIDLGITKEQSVKGAALLEEASGQSSGVKVKMEEEVRKLQLENKKLKSRFPINQQSRSQCWNCGRNGCDRGSRCPANGQQCSKCHKWNHFARVCKGGTALKKKQGANQTKVSFMTDESDSDESLGHIETVRHLSSSNIGAKLHARVENEELSREIILATDTGVSKTIFNITDWHEVNNNGEITKTSKRFRPYGTAYHLPIIGKSKVWLKAENGAEILTWVYIVNNKKETSLLGKEDATRLGIVKLDLKGANEEVVKKIQYIPKSDTKKETIVSGKETQEQIDNNMKQLMDKFPQLFSDKTGKFKGDPIKIQVNSDAKPVIQAPRRIPLHYRDRLKKELEKMIQEDVIEGPIQLEEPGTFLSNLVVTDKKGSDNIRVTLDCQAVNKEIYHTHEPIPTIEELRHELSGSDRFSVLDMTNCYYQFEIEKKARKLYTFRTPWGIYRYKRMVMGTSTASSEIQKRIRELIKNCDNAIHIKDDIIMEKANNMMVIWKTF